MPPTLQRARPYPVLAKNSLDYLSMHRYETEQSRLEDPKESFFIINHRVSEGNLVARLISEGRAAFACTLTSAHSIYREIFVENDSKNVECTQELAWDEGKVRFPLLFQPAVVALEEIKDYSLNGLTDGVHEIWSGSKASFPKGAFLAMAPFWQSQDTFRSILRIRKMESEQLLEGSYEVIPVEDEGFYFEVQVHPGLFDSLSHCRGALRHRESIYAAALAEGLKWLQCKYKEEEQWGKHYNLRALRKKLRDNKIKMWEDDDFSPNQAVAKFHPHVIDADTDDND